MDTFQPFERSRIMRAVKSCDTKPEMKVRRLIHSLGFRYRLHRSDLPGKPDLVFSSRKKIIFVHGCFWHGHDCKRGARIPEANRDYWLRKISHNVERDAKHRIDLERMGWRNFVIWECETKDLQALAKRIQDFLIN